MAYIITYAAKPATLDKIYKVERGTPAPWNCDGRHYISAPTRKECIEKFLHHIGYTWKERAQGIDCLKIAVIIPAPRTKSVAMIPWN